MPLELQISPVDLFSVLSEHCESAFLLESSEGEEKLARFSFLGFSPAKKITLKDGIFCVNGVSSEAKNPLNALKKEIPSSKIISEGLVGGAVGYFSFDYGDKNHGQLWWYDEYDVNLGKPLFPAYNIQDKTNDKFKPGLWRRVGRPWRTNHNGHRG